MPSWLNMVGGDTTTACITFTALLASQVGLPILLKADLHQKEKDNAYKFQPSALLAVANLCCLLVSALRYWFAIRQKAAYGELQRDDNERESAVMLANEGDEKAGSDRYDSFVEEACDEAEDKPGDDQPAGSSHDTPKDTSEAQDSSAAYATILIAAVYAVLLNAIFTIIQTLALDLIALVVSLVAFLAYLVMAQNPIGPRIAFVMGAAQFGSVMFASFAWSTDYTAELGNVQLPVVMLLIMLVPCSAIYASQLRTVLREQPSSSPSLSMAFFGAGCFLNAVAHAVIQILSYSSPRFFSGLLAWPVIMIVFITAIISLAIFAGSAHLDLAHGFIASLLASGFLLLIPSMPLQSFMRATAIPGLVAICTGVSLLVVNRMKNGRKGGDEGPLQHTSPLTAGSSMAWIDRETGPPRGQHILRWPALSTVCVVCVGLISGLHLIPTATVPLRQQLSSSPLSHDVVEPAPPKETSARTLKSPLKDTLAFVRWNHALPERIPLIEEYRPFFRDLHISMPPAETCYLELPNHKENWIWKESMGKQLTDAWRKFNKAKHGHGFSHHNSLNKVNDHGHPPSAATTNRVSPDLTKPHTKHHNSTECPPPITEPEWFNNLDGDNSDEPLRIYRAISDTMQDLLSAPAGTSASTINGLFYFHFDSWLDPMAFGKENFDQIWYPLDAGPRFSCHKTFLRDDPWWPFSPPWSQNEKLPAAIKDVIKHFPAHLQDRLHPKEWCNGWSDMYFIPRHLFQDYINLSKIYFRHGIMHEIAIPSMLHTIDLVRRTHVAKTDDIITHLDCWGGCCMENPDIADLMWYRCGHKLNLTNATLTRSFYDHLDGKAKLLGTPMDVEDEAAVRAEAIIEGWDAEATTTVH